MAGCLAEEDGLLVEAASDLAPSFVAPKVSFLLPFSAACRATKLQSNMFKCLLYCILAYNWTLMLANLAGNVILLCQMS